MRDFFEFLVCSYDGELVLSYAVAGNPRVKPSDLKALMPRFEKYINEHTDEEIAEENQKIYEELHSKCGEPAKPKTYMSGYIYLFECGDKYKIGVSKNVERRIKDLDNRPFKVNLIAKVHSNIAYKVEQTIHNLLKRYKIEGEWYDFPTVPTKEWFESIVGRVEDDTRRNL